MRSGIREHAIPFLLVHTERGSLVDEEADTGRKVEARVWIIIHVIYWRVF